MAIILEAKAISKKYHQKFVLKDVNLIIHQHEKIGLIGANGSGKTTLSEIIAGVRKPNNGEIIYQPNLTIGMQFQNSQYPPGLTIMDMIKYYCKVFQLSFQQDKIKQLISTYQLTEVAKKKIVKLSGGQQQRLNILLSVIHQPQLVILDEVSTGLDIAVKETIFQFLEQNIITNQRAMLLVSHNMEEIERFCERVIYLSSGKIKADLAVTDILQKYGSVFNHTKEMFENEQNKDS
ncbi:ABC transporter ATP-binding protein [Spiroplasma endosymbiont of Megaselia nigra]|uniref:ABC transporter ATP-binding protein n=1 Tax=Spiroplasma endosymbiont of Megaselia nigra TaxID=2478537 RepID=UPI000F87EA7E|nr:ABC transporter ATP-binding protein [Spiroplasma endosymbiont of Megaselia nigra]RUO86884.1 ABC transporter ATP-binding protein [Spiroplasma endosymbiont of Megaselia nigra]